MANPKWIEWTKPEKLILLEGWAKSGLTNEQIAHNMGINAATFFVWKKAIKGPDDERNKIFDALKKGKEVADFEVENALHKSATGYFVEEANDFYAKNPETGELELERRTVSRKYIAPSNTAQIFWLKNRKPADWRDKREQVEEVHNEVKVEIAGELADYAD